MARREGGTGGSARHDRTGPIASAQVILRSQSGKRLDSEVPITAANLADYAPSAADSAAAQSAFRNAGFEAGAVVGISFSITAPLERFEHWFGVSLRSDERGAVSEAGRRTPDGGLELPLVRLPPSLADRVVAVVFSPAAEIFGGGVQMG